MTVARISLGKQGEDIACAELSRLGYEILARRYRTRHGEIDVVAEDGETLVFVEVKARATTEFGAPEEAVTAWKQARVARMALEYLAGLSVADRPCRFDVVSVLATGEGRPVIKVFKGAFDLPSR